MTDATDGGRQDYETLLAAVGRGEAELLNEGEVGPYQVPFVLVRFPSGRIFSAEAMSPLPEAYEWGEDAVRRYEQREAERALITALAS